MQGVIGKEQAGMGSRQDHNGIGREGGRKQVVGGESEQWEGGIRQRVRGSGPQ